MSETDVRRVNEFDTLYDLPTADVTVGSQQISNSSVRVDYGGLHVDLVSPPRKATFAARSDGGDGMLVDSIPSSLIVRNFEYDLSSGRLYSRAAPGSVALGSTEDDNLDSPPGSRERESTR